MLTGALRSLFAVVENYPQLKANENVLALQEEVTTTENQIGFSRQHYNASVLDYNTSIQTFPAVLIAGVFGFIKREFFEAEEAAQAVPNVDLTLGSGGAAVGGGSAPAIDMGTPPAPPAPPACAAADRSGATRWRCGRRRARRSGRLATSRGPPPGRCHGHDVL